MATIVGHGDYKYEIKENWAKLPDGWSFKEVAAVGVDRQDNVYCFTRGEHPVIVFDRDGNFLRSWGEGRYIRAHGVHMGPDDSIYLTFRLGGSVRPSEAPPPTAARPGGRRHNRALTKLPRPICRPWPPRQRC